MFGTSGVRGPVGDEVTAELALSIGRAVAREGADRVVIGRDPRDSGEFLADAAAAGARECGADVVDLGLAATPTIARSVEWQDADAGISVTASHNPAEDNGLKLWQRSGQAFDRERRDRITELVQEDDGTGVPWDEIGARTEWAGAEQRHVEAIVGALDADPDGLEELDVVVDVGNGAGGVTIEALRELGCSVTPLNETPDGRFPARPSEPTAETLTGLQSVVAESDADLGVAHDGDADRMMAVDEMGTFVPGDVLLALFARDATERGDRVAVPVNTSLAVDDALADHGADVTRTQVGDVFVAARAREPDVAFGGEPSGTWIWPEDSLCPDGPLAAARLAALVAAEGPLSALAEEIERYPIRRESEEVEDKTAVMERVREAAASEYEIVDECDGVRVSTDDGWFLVRASGTQPLVRVTAEGRTEAKTTDLFAEGRALLTDSIEVPPGD